MQINITIEKSRQSEFNALVGDLLASPKEVQKSIISARRKAAKWVRTQIVRSLSKETQIPPSLLRNRVVLSRISIKGEMFIGLNPVSVSRLQPKQTKAGVKAKGGLTVKGAFIVDALDYKPVFKRVSDRAYPVEYQRRDIEKEGQRIIEGEILPKLSDKLYDLLEHELKWRILYKQKK
ncbi:hypothetical protein [Halodesulfovibrio aestuarii]|uniref:hypothetical protein n=1 Tax=Halodesulfovibrio aestuarii TaxID=126333 RepID=UPI003D356035